jgi:hypothetical protein
LEQKENWLEPLRKRFMGRPTNHTGPDETYFITTKQSTFLFQVEETANIVVGKISDRAKGNYLLHDFALMPNHLPLILTPARSVSSLDPISKGLKPIVAELSNVGTEALTPSAFIETGAKSSRQLKPSPPRETRLTSLAFSDGLDGQRKT